MQSRFVPLTILSAVLIQIAPLQAQVEIGAFGGVLAPTSTFDIPTTGLSIGFGPTEAKLTTAFTYGLLGRLWVAPRLGLQATVGISDGSLLVQPPFSSAPDTSYSISTTAVTLSFLYRLSTPTIPNAVWLSLGPAWIDQSSPRYEDIEGTSAIGLAFGAGSSLPLNDRLRVSLGLDLFVYPFDLSSSTDDPAGGTQLDFRALAGLSVHFGHDPD